MSPPPLFIFLLLLTLTLLTTPTTQTPTTDLIEELIHLRSESRSGVIHLTDHLLTRLTTIPTPRPFSFLIFFDAQNLHSKSELQLPTLFSEFSLVSSSFLTNTQNDDVSSSNDKLFFFQLEFQHSQRSFARFGVNSLPHIRLVLPHVTDLEKSDKMDQGDFSRLAESMSEFVESRTKVSVGPIHRPPFLSPAKIAIILAILAVWTPFAVKRFLQGNTLLHDYKIWMFGATFVYFFSVSGTMHNIIRKMPMFITDRNDPSKLVFFYQGSGMQLGAEGFAVGFLYTVVGVLLGFVTHGVVKIRSLKVQRFLMVFALIVSFWAVKKVVYLDNWKTGYGIHAYWPSSW
ncbi:putative dolichyl-diphosphooligosaccharide--protein glycosyltransferase subunit 3B [Silene latifolia]|uniref:putative dolichyl-diphosphooligosaccharide--protein glycosyltransferase subunit 3B n=1 Tax=Silene latifolia TaxID=37657 RepID=UPI003D773E54